MGTKEINEILIPSLIFILSFIGTPLALTYSVVKISEIYVYNKYIKNTEKQYKNVVKIGFDQFKKFYNISQNKYNFSDFKHENFILYFSENEMEYYVLVFSYRDYNKVVKFYDQNIKEKKIDKRKDCTINYLNNVQNDINEVKKQAKSYVDESLEIIDNLRRKK